MSSEFPYLKDVHYVYRDARERFDQVIGTGRFNALLVIVIDLQAKVEFGRIILDLNPEYRKRRPSAKRSLITDPAHSAFMSSRPSSRQYSPG